MDLELGLKITHTIDDHVSFANVRVAKDKSTPLFVSKETESTFILTALLNGYRRENVHIEINEDGTHISISGEKPVQEKVMLGWIMYKKEVDIRGFKKVFRIPYGVILDRIKAKFNEHESTLTIVMPKLVKGIRGVEIEEVKEDGVDIEKQQMAQPAAEEVPHKDGTREKTEEENGEAEKRRTEENRRIKGKGKLDEEESRKGNVADEVLQEDFSGGKIQEEAKDSKTQEMQDTTKSVSEKGDDEPKIEEADGTGNEKVGIKDMKTEVADEVAKPSQENVSKGKDAKETIKEDKSTEVAGEVAKPSQEKVVTTQHTDEKASKLPKLEEPKSPAAERETPKPELEEHIVLTTQHTEENVSELPNVEEQIKEPKSPASERETPKPELEEHLGGKPESSESSKPEAGTITTQQEAQGSMKETTDEFRKEGDDVQLQKQEPVKEDPASHQHDKGEEIHGNEIEEASSNEEHVEDKKEVGKCDESSEMEEQTEVAEKSSDHLEKKPNSEKSNNLLCSPFIIAGSALIVSLVMLAINRIRTRKR